MNRYRPNWGCIAGLIVIVIVVILVIWGACSCSKPKEEQYEPLTQAPEPVFQELQPDTDFLKFADGKEVRYDPYIGDSFFEVRIVLIRDTTGGFTLDTTYTPVPKLSADEADSILDSLIIRIQCDINKVGELLYRSEIRNLALIQLLDSTLAKRDSELCKGDTI